MGGRKIVLLGHVSLDGSLAGPNGEMQWIRVDDDALWDDVEALTGAADTAIFGRTTYEMMESYSPTAGDAPERANTISTTVAGSTTRPPLWSRALLNRRWGASGQARVVKDAAALPALKDQSGANMLLIGSASVACECARLGLIDE